MKFRRLLNSEFDYVSALADQSGIPLDQCPTCLTTPIRASEDVEGWENGTYRFRGVDFPCYCDLQKNLRKHYLLAGIPTQYMKLDWDDFTGSQEVWERIAEYLSKWQSFKANGMGMEFFGQDMGTGKTFAATHIGKELIKMGERVYFHDFKEVISAYGDHHELVQERLMTTPILILDEVISPFTEKQQDFFAFKFEELIRHRTNNNQITIMTTNLAPEQLHKAYPRTYSLLEAKQVRTELFGEDARQTTIADENLELALNEEIRPIS